MIKLSILLVLLFSLYNQIVSTEKEEPVKDQSANQTNINSTNSAEEDEQNTLTLNKAKLIGCIRLARSRVNKDKQRMEELIELAGSDKVVSTLLINCYSKVSIDQATDFVSIENHEDIDSLIPENQNLLDVDKWTEIYRKKDKNLIYAEMEKMKEATESYFKIQNILKKESEEEDKKNNVKTEKKTEGTQDEDVRVDKSKRPVINILGFDLNEMNPILKNVLGFGFIILICVLFYFGLKALTDKKEVKKPKKNKKN